jgi:hypothetical protein
VKDENIGRRVRKRARCIRRPRQDQRRADTSSNTASSAW